MPLRRSADKGLILEDGGRDFRMVNGFTVDVKGSADCGLAHHGWMTPTRRRRQWPADAYVVGAYDWLYKRVEWKGWFVGLDAEELCEPRMRNGEERWCMDSELFRPMDQFQRICDGDAPFPW